MQQPLVQKLPLDEHHSFIAKTYRTPHFEVGWHQHVEFELILFTEGSGLGFVGNHASEFETGDIYFIGSNLPHTFQKREAGLITSAVVVQFRDDFWGKDFLALPESRELKKLLELSACGLKVTGYSREQLAPLIEALEHTAGFERLLLLQECLHLLATRFQFKKLATDPSLSIASKRRETIDRVFEFTIENFRKQITLAEVAAIACMSVPAFCSYFKRSTQKTYIDFVNEIRIGYASTLLMETTRPVPEVCYESGYQTLANFHKHFLRHRKCSPLQFRKQFLAKLAIPQTNIGIV